MKPSHEWTNPLWSIGRAGRQCFVVLGVLGMAHQATASPVYKCERLKESDRAHGHYYASAINDAGEIVGDAMSYLAIKWSERQAQVLEKETFAMGTRVNAINNTGVAVGTSVIDGPHPEGPIAFKWQADGSLERLAQYGEERTFANDINDLGVVVGSVYADELSQATLWNGSKRTALPALEAGKSAYANQLNNRDVVVGVATKTVDGLEVERAVRWHKGKARDLGALQGMNSSQAYSVNDSGLIVGSSWNSGASGSPTPVAWVGGVIQAMDKGDGSHGYAVGVNRGGEVIGYTAALGPAYWADVNAAPLKIADLISADKPCRGPDGQAVDLQGVDGINARGAMAATGFWLDANGSTESGGFRLVPLKTR